VVRSIMDKFARVLRKIDAFNRGKRVMVTKVATTLPPDKLKNKKYFDKDGILKTFIRVKATDIGDL
jgi:hypothetical protein